MYKMCDLVNVFMSGIVVCKMNEIFIRQLRTKGSIKEPYSESHLESLPKNRSESRAAGSPFDEAAFGDVFQLALSQESRAKGTPES